jgi:hypothetical protein
MSLFDKVLGTFVEIDPKPSESQTAPQTAVPQQTAPQSIPAGSMSMPSWTPPPAGVDPAMMSSLNDVVNGRKTPYTALLETAQSFATLIPDSNTRFKAAFVSLKRPADDIVKSIDVHIADVDAQLVSFNGRAQAELQAKSGSLREQAAMLGRDTEAAKTQIAAIDAQRIQKITDNQGTAATLDAQANSAEADIKGTMSRFEATVNAKKQELLGQKQTLSTLLN